MATNVLLPLSPSGESPITGGHMTGKYFRSVGRSQKGSSSKGSGSLTRKGPLPPSEQGRSSRDAKEKDKTERDVTDIDPQSYRNSILHNICVEMLEEGFHKSFTELFQLVERQRQDHIRAGPAAILLEPLIEGDSTKLEQLKTQLTAGEEAGRGGDMAGVYMAQRRLAVYFESTKDTWLSDHFHHRCLETGKMVEGDSRRMEGEAHCHVGLALENRGELNKASHHMETFHSLARKHKWFTDNGEELHKISCEHLRRMYTKIAEQVHAESSQEAIKYLKKAHEVAREGGDGYQEGLASYRLGNAYESVGEHDTAIKYHKSYLERCKHYGDDTGVGNAYEALSISFESKGDVENAVKFLEMFVEVSERAGLATSLAKACSAVGIMHNTLGDYKKAVEYFDRCYKICRELGDTESLHLARVHYGMAKAHLEMGSHCSCVFDTNTAALESLVLWKDTRTLPSGHRRSRDAT